MATKSEMIASLRAKFDAWAPNPPAALPLLSEGATYRMELTASETVVRATLRRIVDDAPLGRGFSFQLPGRRVFIYERDLMPGPGGMLLAMAA
jgi:hypothetical protein